MLIPSYSETDPSAVHSSAFDVGQGQSTQPLAVPLAPPAEGPSALSRMVAGGMAGAGLGDAYAKGQAFGAKLRAPSAQAADMPSALGYQESPGLMVPLAPPPVAPPAMPLLVPLEAPPASASYQPPRAPAQRNDGGSGGGGMLGGVLGGMVGGK